MPRKSKKQTEAEKKALAEMESKIAYTYGRAYRELEQRTNAYFRAFAEKDDAMLQRLDAGEITQSYYNQWRLNQIGRGERWETLRDNAAKRAGQANQAAAAYVNDKTPGLYSLAANWEAYRIEGAAGASFTLVNERAVKNLIDGNNQYEFRVLSPNPVRDYLWNTQRIERAVTQSIIQGESIKGMAARFMDVMQNNYKAALRNARTAYTSALNAGTWHTYQAARDMGIELQKEWQSYNDGRTRESHEELDGVRVPVDDAFPNGLLYPGDPAGDPAEVYNCRCTMLSVIPGVNDGDTEHDAESYDEWLQRKQDAGEIEPEETETPAADTELNLNLDASGAGWYTVTDDGCILDCETGEIHGKPGMFDVSGVDIINSATGEIVVYGDDLERAIGVRRGPVMTFEEADTGSVNPSYGWSRGYSINCQTCCPTFEARRRGFDVFATSNERGSHNEKLSYHTNLCYIDPNTGKHPRYLYDDSVKTANQCYTWLERTIKQDERYSIEFFWRSGGGHIVNMERDANGIIFFKDNQRGMGEPDTFKGKDAIVDYLKRVKFRRYERYYGPKVLRLDNLEFDPVYAGKIFDKKIQMSRKEKEEIMKKLKGV